MAHKLADGNRGEKALLSVGETPWHEEGHIVPRGDNAEHDLSRAMELAGLDFEVVKSANFVEIDGEVVQSGSYSTIRTDNKNILGNVGAEYKPLQNEQAFSPLEPILNEGLATVETAGALREGATVWMMVKFQKDELLRRVKEENGEVENMEESLEEIAPYSLFLNYHDGSGKAKVRTTPIRVVCNNTLQFSLNKKSEFSLSVKHTGTVEERYKEATEKLFSNIVSRFSSFSDHRELFKNTTIPQDVFEDEVLDEVVPVDHLEAKIRANEGSAHTETALEKNYEKRGEIKERWYEGEGHTGDASAWEAYNGVVEYLDHSDSVRGTDGGRVDKMVSGSIKDKKERVFENLHSYCMNN